MSLFGGSAPAQGFERRGIILVNAGRFHDQDSSAKPKPTLAPFSLGTPGGEGLGMRGLDAVVARSVSIALA